MPSPRAAAGWGILVLLLAGTRCAAGPGELAEIPFLLQLNGRPFACDTSVDGVELGDMRLYVHDFRWVDAEGRETPAPLTPDGTWQTDRVAMLDFEDGSGPCRNGTRGTHTSVSLRAPHDEQRALRFRVGIPFELNHVDPTTAAAPLNLGRMHWGWQAGYKFLRLEASAAGGPTLAFHLGSTGCQGAMGRISACRRGNRPAVELTGFVPGHSSIVLELATLFGQLSGAGSGVGGRGEEAGSDRRVVKCMAAAQDPSCAPLFAAFGLDAESGRPAGPQELFALR